MNGVFDFEFFGGLKNSEKCILLEIELGLWICWLSLSVFTFS